MLKRMRNRDWAGLRRLAPLAWWLIPLCLMLTVFILPVRADTPVGGPIVSDTTWTLANSPYIVVENIDVWEGVTLTIEPGVVVRFAKEKKLQVSGELIAQGTPGSPIAFTSNEAVPQPGDWANIEFTASAVVSTLDPEGNYISGSVLQHCIVEFAGYNVESAVEARSLLIEDSTIQSNATRGIGSFGTELAPGWISRSTISANEPEYSPTQQGAVYAEYSTISRSTIVGNRAGSALYVKNSVVKDNVITGNVGGNAGGVYAEHSTVNDNTVVDNDGLYGGIYAKYSDLSRNVVASNDGSGIVAWYSSTVNNNTVFDNSGGLHGSGICAFDNSSVTDNIVSRNSGRPEDSWGGGIYASQSTVSGNIVTRNSAARGGGGIRAFASTVSNNLVSENVVTGDLGYGGGIYAEYCDVLGNTITRNTVYGETSGSGAYLASYSSLFLYNTVVGNDGPLGSLSGGVRIDVSSEMHYNNIYGNVPFDVSVATSNDINGTDNYWGTITSVDILDQVYDWYDDSDLGKFLYIPYLQDPDPDAPVPAPSNLTGLSQDGMFALDWDPIPSTTTGYGYKVYYDTDEPAPPYEGTGLDQGASPIDVGDLTEYTLTGLDPNATYYAAVTAYDTLGREGWYSNVINSLRRVYLPLILKSF